MMAALSFIFSYVFFAILLSILTRYTKIPKPVIRKIYHIFASFSFLILLYGFESWIKSIVFFVSFFVIIMFFLTIFKNIKIFQPLRFDRKGEGPDLRKQLVFVIVNYALLILIFRGFGGETDKYHAIVGVLMWGVGDAFAAIIGTCLGENKFKHFIFDNKKTYEGTYAFFVSGFIINVFIFILFGKIPLFYSLLFALILAFIGAFIEAVSKKGLDNFVLPVLTSSLSYSLVFLLNFFGR